jgi:lipopolysaccharide export system permease protein
MLRSMTIIDRYLLRQFTKTFLICFLSLLGLYVVFDGFTNLESFLRIADKQGGLLKVVGHYYAYHAILFFDRTVGFVNLIAAMFTVTWIQRHNELVALMAAGISRVRVAIPVIGAVVVVIVLAALNRELLVPRYRDELSRKPSDLAGDVTKQFSETSDEESDIRLRGESAVAIRQEIVKPSFRLPASLDVYGRDISARTATYKEPQGNRPTGYLFTGVDRPKEIARQPSLLLNGRPVVITPRDAPDWLQPDQCFVVSGVSFEQLTNGQAWRDFSSTAQLIRGLHNPSLYFGGNIRVTVHSRIVQPLLDLTLLFLGLPLVMTRESRNVFIAMGLSAGVTLAFMVFVLALARLGSIYAISPALAVWVPLMIFVPVAVELAISMTK